MLFIDGDGLVSKESASNLTLDLVVLRDAFFAPSDYYYNILRWKKISISYSNSISNVSNQKIEIGFNIPQGETSTVTRVFQLPTYLIGNLVIDSLTIHDYDNGRIQLRKNDLTSINSLQLETDLPDRPQSAILSQDSFTVFEIEDTLDWEIGWKVRLQGNEILNPLLTITDIDSINNKITIDQQPNLPQPIELVLSSPNNTNYQVEVLNDGTLTTTEVATAPNSLFKILGDKALTTDIDKFYRLVVDNEGILGIFEETENIPVANLILQSPDETKYSVNITPDEKVQTNVYNETIVGLTLSFALNNELTLSQLIDYKDS